jgi:hypothetical protein
MLAGVAALDWSRATLSRPSEHLRAAESPEITEGALAEVRAVSTRLARLRKALEEAALTAPGNE